LKKFKDNRIKANGDFIEQKIKLRRAPAGVMMKLLVMVVVSAVGTN